MLKILTTICPAFLLLGLAGAAPAPPPAQITVGDVTATAPHFIWKAQELRLFGGVTIQSPQYDAQAEQVTLYFANRKRSKEQQQPADASDDLGVTKIVAEGDPARGTQVTGHVQQPPPLDRQYTVKADQAVYVPDGSRPHGGRIDFTGHPKMTVLSQKELAAPSVTTADRLTVLLGQGDDYPQVAGDGAHMTLTPRQ